MNRSIENIFWKQEFKYKLMRTNIFPITKLVPMDWGREFTFTLNELLEGISVIFWQTFNRVSKFIFLNFEVAFYMFQYNFLHFDYTLAARTPQELVCWKFVIKLCGSDSEPKMYHNLLYISCCCWDFWSG